MSAAVIPVRPAVVGVIASPEVEMVCCPRCEHRFKKQVRVKTVERIVVNPHVPTVEEILRTFPLTHKELMVALHLAEGKRLREIAVSMMTTEATVKNYVRSIYVKTEIRSTESRAGSSSSRQLFRMKIDRLRFGQ